MFLYYLANNKAQALTQVHLKNKPKVTRYKGLIKNKFTSSFEVNKNSKPQYILFILLFFLISVKTINITEFFT